MTIGRPIAIVSKIFDGTTVSKSSVLRRWTRQASELASTVGIWSRDMRPVQTMRSSTP